MTRARAEIGPRETIHLPLIGITVHNPRRMRVSTRQLFIIALLTLAGILYFGLTPKGFDRTNNATALHDGSGIRFSPTGIAYADGLRVDSDDFAFELVFLPSDPPAPGFSILAMFHGGSDSTQMIVGQWKSQIVVMNGDDYDHSRRDPRVVFDTHELESGNVTLRVGTRGGISEVRVNEQSLGVPDGLVLELPVDANDTVRLFLGNGVTVRQPWEGVLTGASLEIAAPDSDSTGGWKRVLTLNSDAFAAASAGRPGVLTIPERLPVFEHRILAAGISGWNRSRGLAFDVVINTLGFIPFGIVGFAVALRLRAGRRGLSVLLVVLCGGLLSLGMEVAQAWLPARDSSLLDLALNTLGTAAGALIASVVLRRTATER